MSTRQYTRDMLVTWKGQRVKILSITFAPSYEIVRILPDDGSKPITVLDSELFFFEDALRGQSEG